MLDTLNKFWQFIVANWEIVLLVATWLGILAVAYRRRRDWKRKRFVHQVNFSLNYVEDDTLKLRTLLEDSAQAVWLNEHGVSLVVKAAERTTTDQPFLKLASGKDMEFVKRAVLNVLSERFSPVFLARSLGIPVAKDTYVFAITCERFGTMRTQKLRVILIRKDDLAAMFADRTRKIGVDRSQHRDRLKTLEHMASRLKSRRDRDQRLLGEVELGVVLPMASEVDFEGGAEPESDRGLPLIEVEPVVEVATAVDEWEETASRSGSSSGA